MTSLTAKTFKLKWHLEDFSLYTKNVIPLNGHWLATRIFTIDALGDRQMMVKIFPRSVDGSTVFSLQRNSNVEETGNVTFHYSLTIHGKGKKVLFRKEGVVHDLPPGFETNIECIRNEVLSPQHLEKDRLDVTVEVRLRRSAVPIPIDVTSVEWKDELRALSYDMRRLLRSGYRSDIDVVSSDRCPIRAHLCILMARWRMMYDDFRHSPCRPTRIGFGRMNRQLLSGFVSYLYTGTIPHSEVTGELFECVADRCPSARRSFYTRSSDVAFRTRHSKEQVSFTWYVSDAPVDFRRVLSLRQLDNLELFVHVSTVANDNSRVANDNSKVRVTFSLSSLPTNGWVQLQCSATVVTGVDRIAYSAGNYFDKARRRWSFPHLLSPTDARRVEFELCFSFGQGGSNIESAVTEFHTGSLGVRNVELLAKELGHFFMESQMDEIFDANLVACGGTFLSCKSFLGVRSKTLLKAFEGTDSTATVTVTQTDNGTVSAILEYLYTGWTKMASAKEARKILSFAREMALDGLVRKCEQSISIFNGRGLQ